MSIKSWTVTYRNKKTSETITAAVFAETMEKARAVAEENGYENWTVGSIERQEDTLARLLIAEFAEKQQDGHFACPRCGAMAMNPESATRNALSRRATVYVCDSCGAEEAIEDMGAMPKLPLREWAIARAPELWRAKK